VTLFILFLNYYFSFLKQLANVLTAQQQIPNTTLNIQTALAASGGGNELLHSPSNSAPTNQMLANQQQLQNLPPDLLYQAALLSATQLGFVSFCYSLKYEKNFNFNIFILLCIRHTYI
jgi:hypothetical protein